MFRVADATNAIHATVAGPTSHLQLIAEPGLNLLGCCNELNAGYAAKGYGRARRIGENVVAFTVGRLKCAERDRRCVQRELAGHLHNRWDELQRLRHEPNPSPHDRVARFHSRASVLPNRHLSPYAAQYDGEGNKLFDPRPHTVSLLEFGAVEDGTQGDGTLPGSKMLMEIPRKAKDEITVCCQ
ncbi:hypothetical protein ACFX2J_036842 [Malus domestica]